LVVGLVQDARAAGVDSAGQRLYIHIVVNNTRNNMTIKPQLACDFDEEKLKFPLIAQPKIDGVRALNLTGTLTGRSLKQHKNKHTTSRLSRPEFIGFDGELALEGQWTSPRLCRDTTSAVNRIEGFPALDWWLFDYIAPETINLPYEQRRELLGDKVRELERTDIKAVPYEWVYNLEQLLNFEKHWLDMGFEGVIIRDPQGAHKSGRATVRGGSYLRIKRFTDAEARVVRIVEAMENQNEAKTNELGRTERSSHQENMVPKGMVGSLECIDLETHTEITVGPGEMTHDDRIFFFNNPSLLVDQLITYKSFRHGVKDKPRFPTFKNIRAPEDM